MVAVSLGALLIASFAERSGARERQAALMRSETAHARNLLEHTASQLRKKARDYAGRDDVARVFTVGDSAQLQTALQAESDFDLLVLMESSGRVVLARDPTGFFQSGTIVDSPLPLELARHSPGVLRLWKAGSTPIWIVGSPVRPEAERASIGLLLVGRVLSDSYVRGLSAKLGRTLELVVAGGPSELDEELHSSSLAVVLPGLDGKMMGAFRVVSTDVPLSVNNPWVIALCAICALAAGLTLMGWAAQREVVVPLATLRDTVNQLRWGNPIATGLPTSRRDELGQLALEIAMLAGELRTSEHGRSKSEARNRALLNAIPDMMFLLDRDCTFLDFKPSHTLDTLVPPSVFIGKNVRQFFPKTIAEKTKQLVDRALSSEDAQILEYALPDDEGVRHYEARFVASSSNEVLAIVREITERKRAEETQARLTTILDATPDLVATASEDGEILYLNAAGQRMLGLPRGGRPLNLWKGDFLPSWVRDMLREHAVPIARREGVWSGESAFFSKDGQEQPVSQVILAHRSEEGVVDYFSTVARDISKRKQLEAKLLYLADHDPLTHLFGRRRFQEELGRELARARRQRTVGALLFIDLDEFKYVNDSLGHNAGDQLLVSVAKLLSSRLRESDLIARLGGDEFGILLPDSKPRQAQQVAGQLLEAIRHHAIMVEGQPVGITASIGIALYPKQGKTVEELSSRADLAMYQAKVRGRNGFVVYTPDKDWQAQVALRLSGEKQIREALEKERFLLHAQPIMDLRSGRIVQYEVLVRMLDDQDRLVMPGAFIGIAERFGLIHALESWVVSHAVRVLRQLMDAGRDVRMSVNLSGKSLSNSELVVTIQREIADSGVDPSRLTFEVTETAAITDTSEALNFATALKELGCKLALDDFGVGFLSLHHLKYLPVDYLKIDGSFVRDLPRNRVDQHLVKTIVEVSRALNKNTIAEFVSDEETVCLLRECGVDYAQGYHIGRPGPVSQILEATRPERSA